MTKLQAAVVILLQTCPQKAHHVKMKRLNIVLLYLNNAERHTCTLHAWEGENKGRRRVSETSLQTSSSLKELWGRHASVGQTMMHKLAQK